MKTNFRLVGALILTTTGLIYGVNQTPKQPLIENLDQLIEAKKHEIANLQSTLQIQRTSSFPQVSSFEPTAAEVPYHAKVGECYAKANNDGSLLEVTPTLVQAKTQYVPAKTEWVNEKILIEEAVDTFVQMPAKYTTTKERVLVRPARNVWKKASHKKGNAVCLVKEPAIYKTVIKKVLVAEGQIKKITLPAKYKTIKVKRVIRQAEVIEPNVQDKTASASHSSYKWTRVVCADNLSKDKVQKIQTALLKNKAYKGPIDGKLSPKVFLATEKFAKQNGISHGPSFISMEVIDALNVKL